jgi:hypothetical protein
MYKTIEAIQTGSLPFKTHHLFYKGPKPLTPLHWMEGAYEIDAHDVLAVIQDQLAMSAFKDQFDNVPYKEFNNKGECIWSNLMSAQWAFKQAVCSLCIVFWITFLTLFVTFFFLLTVHITDYHWDRHLYFVIPSYHAQTMTHTPPSDDSVLILRLVVLVACDSD